MYGASSTQNRRGTINSDGSWNIHCYQCGDFICVTTTSTSRALCELCRRILEGEIITPEAVAEYKLAKRNRNDCTMLVLQEMEKHEKKFSLSSMTGEFLSAIGFKRKETSVPSETSTKISKSKKRGRIFESVDLEKEMAPPEGGIGSMLEVDAELEKQRNGG